MRIAVIGAGVGGLSLSLAFHQHPETNVEIVTYERDSAFDSRPQGYSLTIQQGIKILEKLGLAKQVRSVKCRSMGFDTLNYDGKYFVFVDDPKRKFYTANVPIPRQELRRLLIEQLPPNFVKWGKALSTISHAENGKVVLEFSDGEVSQFDAVIGCDGVRSIVRDYIVGDKLNYLGVVAINGIAKNYSGHKVCNNRAFHSLDGTNRLFVKPFSENSWMWQLTFPVEEAQLMADKQRQLDLAKEKINHWHSPIPELLSHTQVDSLRCGGIYDRPMPDYKPWRKEGSVNCHNVTILGDAAHPMSPFKGQGANSALEDAWRIYSLISQKKDLNTIDEQFEDEMWIKTRDRVLNSRKGVEFLHTKDALIEEHLFKFLKVEKD